MHVKRDLKSQGLILKMAPKAEAAAGSALAYQMTKRGLDDWISMSKNSCQLPLWRQLPFHRFSCNRLQVSHCTHTSADPLKYWEAWGTFQTQTNQNIKRSDSMEPSGAGIWRGCYFTLPGQEQSVFGQINTGTVSMATLGRLPRDRVEHVCVYPNTTMSSWAETGACTASTAKTIKIRPLTWPMPMQPSPSSLISAQ